MSQSPPSKVSHHDRSNQDGSPEKKPIPDTGWRGDPAVPSQAGGDTDEDFFSKPPYSWTSDGNLFVPRYQSACWCGNVSFEFHGDPLNAKFCHCTDCQRLHGAPFQWAVIFPKTSVRLLKNVNYSLHWFGTERAKSAHHVPCKVSCHTCRAPLFDEGRNTVLAYPSGFRFKNNQVPADFQPTCHIFYGQRIMDIPDGIPKWEGHKGQSRLIAER